jgi:hypothetical protein
VMMVAAVETSDLCVSWDYATEWLQNGSKRPCLVISFFLLGFFFMKIIGCS